MLLDDFSFKCKVAVGEGLINRLYVTEGDTALTNQIRKYAMHTHMLQVT